MSREQEQDRSDIYYTFYRYSDQGGLRIRVTYWTGTLRREEDLREIPFDNRGHGWEIGYLGTGPKQVSMAILNDYFSRTTGEEITEKHWKHGNSRIWDAHIPFMHDVIGRLSQTEEKQILKGSDIQSGLRIHGYWNAPRPGVDLTISVRPDGFYKITGLIRIGEFYPELRDFLIALADHLETRDPDDYREPGYLTSFLTEDDRELFAVQQSEREEQHDGASE